MRIIDYYHDNSERVKANSISILKIIFIFCCFGCVEKSAPPIDLEQILEKGQTPAIVQALSGLKPDGIFADWRMYFRGRLAEEEGNSEQAVSLFRRVSADHPASPDATIGIARIWVGYLGKDGMPSVDASLLEKLIENAEGKSRILDRRDLLSEAALIRIRLLVYRGEFRTALLMLNDMRSRGYSPHLVNEVTTLRNELQQKLVDLGDFSVASFVVEEAKLLLKESHPDQAYNALDYAKLWVAKDSPAYWEVEYEREAVLRSLKMTTEANSLLMAISASGVPGFADRALLSAAKNAWNANDHKRAFEVLESLDRHFPQSRFSSEALYVKGRIYEEELKFPQAIKAYQELVERGPELDLSIKVQNRLAWVLVALGSKNEAISHFERISKSIGKQAADASNTNGQKPKVDLQSDLAHATFWAAYLSLPPAIEKGRAGHEDKTQKALEQLSQLADGHERGYYALLSKQILKRHRGEGAMSKPTDSSGDLHISDTRKQECQLPFTREQQEKFKVLKDLGLRVLLAKEITWASRVMNHNGDQDKADPENKEQTALLQFKRYLAEAAALREGNLFQDALKSAQKAAPVLSGINDSEQKYACADLLEVMLFPQPYTDLFSQASLNTKAPRELLLAVARTESNFDPQAKSAADAHGLMQLLDSTAAGEGLMEGESLEDPSVNIRLGSKHIGTLLEKYGTGENLVYAIAAYNAGSTAVDRWKSRYEDLPPLEWVELISYPETKDYVKRVLSAMWTYQGRE